MTRYYKRYKDPGERWEEISREEAIGVLSHDYDNPEQALDSVPADGKAYLGTCFVIVMKKEG